MRKTNVFAAVALVLAAVLAPLRLTAGEACPSCIAFDQLNSDIRDGRIGREAARAEIKRLLPQLRQAYAARGGTPYPREAWRFPLEGYDLAACHTSKRDYVAKGYDFFAGNRHGGHPSFDLFIRDRNQDDLDDRSGAPVPVLSMTGGIVVALAESWQPGSRLRGGKYLWIYDPANELLVYYAHNRQLLVGLGEVVKPGERIASVGRSGLNAYRRRSPTHLHLTCLQLVDGSPRPVNVYGELQRLGRTGR